MNKAVVRISAVLGGMLLLGCAAEVPEFGGLDGQRTVTGDWPDGGSVAVPPVFGQGVAGVDYDPQIVVLWYRADASWPVQLPHAAPVAGIDAAAGPNPILRVNRSFEPLTDAFAAVYGMRIRQQVYWQAANFASFNLPPEADGLAVLAELNQRYPECIESAGFAGLATMDWIPTDPDYSDNNSYGGVLWGMKKVNCAPGWDYTLGDKSIRIGLVDSGVRLTHEELAGVVMTAEELEPEIPSGYHLDVLHGDNTVEDVSGHGTMCAGAIGAAANGNTIIGVAPGCSIIPIKIHDSGSFPWTDGYAGITLAHLLGADVISCSWGHTGGYNTQEQTIIKQVSDGGSLVVAAGGNDDTTDEHYPSDFSQVVCVGASDPWDARCDFSNYGPNVDIAAPGQWMKEALNTGDSDYDNGGGGTSYACPMVAGAAGLILSADNTLTNAEVRTFLETTGDPVTGGFQPNVLRLNVGNALAQTQAVRLSLAYHPAKLVQSGTVSLAVEVKGDAAAVDCLLNGTVVATRTSTPWEFTVDTSGIDFGIANIVFRAMSNGSPVETSIKLLVDNTTGVFPLSEGFEDTNPDIISLDVKDYDPVMLQGMRTYGEYGSYWTEQDLVDNGGGYWADETTAAWEGFTCKRYGNTAAGYDPFEMDVLVTRRLDLTGVEDPTLVFHHHYNIQRGNRIYDRGWVYITADDGATFTKGLLSSGQDALFSGYVADWSTAEIDLGAFSGQVIQVVLAFESSRQTAGQNADEPAGWWVDDFTVATGYQEHVPAIAGVAISPQSTVGEIAAVDQIEVEIMAPTNVGRAQFVLHYLPAIGADPQQVLIDATMQPFQALLDVPADVPNQVAQIEVSYFSTAEMAGPAKILPLYIFNQLGDVNADGSVDQLDTDSYVGKVGLTIGMAGYLPFFDSDLDGTITEADAGDVGYHWGE